MWTATGILLAVVIGYTLYSKSLWKEGRCGYCGTDLAEGKMEEGCHKYVCPECGGWMLVEMEENIDVEIEK